jgi:SWI/SNF-related matrix-associated actin-dependent regulator 1 of chromatin subfamily A
MPTKLYRYQREDVERMFYEFKGRCILGSEMGLGKTPQSLFFAKNHIRPGPVIVICPAIIKSQWRREAAKHVGIRADVLYGQTPPKRSPIARARIYIINYDILQYWVDWLRKLKPVLVIIDEFHRIRSWEAQCTQAAVELCKGVKHVIPMSGTPIVNDHADLFPVLHILFPKRFKSFINYAFKYCQPRMYRGRWIYKGARNGKKLRRFLVRHCLIRRLKKDVIKDLPPKIVTVIPIRMGSAARKEYNNAERDIVRWLEQHRPGKASRARFNQARAKFNYLKRLAVDLTMKERQEWLANFHEESNSKILVFGWHVEIMKAFHTKFPNSVLIIGETSQKKRDLRVRQFNGDKKTKDLFGNLQAAGAGWNCTSSSNVAFMELGFTPADHNQAIDRCHGIGRGVKGEPVNVFFLVAEDTIEESICSILTRKQGTSDKVIDGKSRRKASDRNIYDLLERRLIGKRRR